MFIYICKAPPYFQFTRKLNNWNLEKVYLVVGGCLLIICGRLLVVFGRLLVACGRLLVVCGRLLLVCDRLCPFGVVLGGLWSLPVLVTTDLESLLLFISCYFSIKLTCVSFGYKDLKKTF